MLLNQLFAPKKLFEGGNLASHTATGEPTVGWSGIPGKYSAGKIDSKNRAAMQPVVKQLLVDINNTFTRQYGRPIWSHELLEKEVETFISGSSKWFMLLRQPNPRFDPSQPVSDANPKEIGITDKDFQRVKKKVGDIDTQIDRRLEPQIEEFVHKNIGKSVGSATLLGTKKGSDQWLALWQINEPPITLQVDLEFSDYTTDERGFEIPTEWAQVSHGSQWEDLQAGMKGVFRQWLYRSLAKIAPTEKYIAKMAGAGKNKGIKLFGGDDGKELIGDINNPPPPLHDANFSFAVASVGGGGVRAKYRQPRPEENVPLEINGVPVMVPLSSAESNYIKDMSQQFEQFFGVPAKDNDTQTMASFVGTVELMKQYFTPEQQQVAVQEFLKINFGKGAQMIDADDPKSDFETKMTAIDYLLDNTGMKALRKQALQMAQEYEDAYNSKKENSKAVENTINNRSRLSEAEVKAQLRKNMPHLRALKPIDLLDLLDEIHDGNGNFKLQNVPLNVKIDGFGGRFGKNAEGKPFMGTSNTPPRYEANFLAYHQSKGTTDPEILNRSQLFDNLFKEMMNAVAVVDQSLGEDFLVDKQITCEVLYLPFATETPDGKLKFVGINYDKLPEGVQLALVPYRVSSASTGEDLPDTDRIVKALTNLGQQDSVMFISNKLTQKDALDVTGIVPPLENLETFKEILSSSGKGSMDLKRQVKAALEPVALALEKAIIEDPNIVGKDMLGSEYEGIVLNTRLGPVKVTSSEQRKVIADKQAAAKAARVEQPGTVSKVAVVAIGSFVGHIGHEQLWNYTVDKAKEVGGDPYLFMGNAVGKDDPIPVETKLATWHKLYPEYKNNISATISGGSLMQKIKHELINPLPGKPPRYDNIIIMVGEDQANMNIANALMKAVNKFQGYEHVKVSLEATPRGTGMSFSKLRNILKDTNATPQQQLDLWIQAFDVNKLGVDWIKGLMDITRKGMGIQMPQQQPQQIVPERLFNALIMPQLNELDEPKKKSWDDYGMGNIGAPAKPKEKFYQGWSDYEDEKRNHEKNKQPEPVGEDQNELKDLQLELWDFYKDVYGVRPRNWTPEEWNDIEFLRAQQNHLVHVVNSMSPEERAEQGWIGEAMSAGVRLQRALQREKERREREERLGKELLNPTKREEPKKQNEDSNEGCPPATQDIKLNLKNRQKAIDEYGYGPLNPDMPNRKFWMAKQSEWNLDSPDEAKQSLCGNCAAFDQRTETLDCISQGIGSDQGAEDPTIDAGDLGYCRFLKFKCASRRTCDAWVIGGPLTDKKGVAEGSLNDTQKKIEDTINKLEDRLKHAKTPEQWDNIKNRIERLQAGLKRSKQGVAEGSLNEFAPDGFNGGDDDEGFSPEIAKMAQEDGFTKGAGLADGATLERAITINHWHSTHGGMYKQYFAKGFKAGRMDKIRHNNKQYNLNLKLMKDGSIRHGEQGVAESDDKYIELSKKIRDLAQAGKEGEANKLRYELNRLLMLDRDKKRRKEQGVAEGSGGAKYKVRSIGKDKKGEYYVSPSTGEKVYKKAKVGDHEVPGSKEIKPKVEAMLPKSAFAGSKKNKLGSAGQWKNIGPSKNRPARAGDLVGGAAESVIPVREDVENIISSLVEQLRNK